MAASQKNKALMLSQLARILHIILEISLYFELLEPLYPFGLHKLINELSKFVLFSI